ncbi:AbrB family transcriptional regulator [Bacillus sp. UMB0893]|uniref:AbrB family transcriptional regulator n=1 Tax=Bacillus sp. UMB0893 TaxID=2066053 RepID=UPI000C78A880|nr:AbrB family transcriptional regulator [Bacillus sp. UMB0893]PLR66186.1 hypothetical protein CYJ36_18960 [Bacillus sp. UMB0893]
MQKSNVLFHRISFIILSSIGGLLLSLTGLSIGWMIGTLLTAALLSFLRPRFLQLHDKGAGLPKYWLFIGQCILGMELGQKINVSAVSIFKEHGATILAILLLSILFTLLSGFVLWKFSHLDILTSFFGTAPGGLSAMPGIAEEVGANTAVVSLIQTMRIFLVVLTVPIVVSLWIDSTAYSAVSSHFTVEPPNFKIGQLVWTLVLAFTAWGGYYLGKILKFPAPWLLGSMVSVSLVQLGSSSFIGYELTAWWPESLIIFSQILIAASIGSRFQKEMLIGLKKTLLISLLSTIGLISAMFLCAIFVSNLTGISLVTAVLAFAPGGIAEMTTTSVVLHADSTFVLSVQVLRVVIVCLVLPPFFRLLHVRDARKKMRSHAHI